MIAPSDSDTLVYHFRRAFTDGDQNYEAQFWYARYLFESSDVQKRREAKTVFQRLRNVQMQYQSRHEVRDRMLADEQLRQFTGSVSKKEMEYGFVTVDGRGDFVFFHKNDTDQSVWDALRPQSRVRFNIGFTFGGPLVINIEKI